MLALTRSIPHRRRTVEPLLIFLVEVCIACVAVLFMAALFEAADHRSLPYPVDPHWATQCRLSGGEPVLESRLVGWIFDGEEG